jgi:hypothetical protein
LETPEVVADFLKTAVPLGVRKGVVSARLAVRRPTAALRPLPDFLVIGVGHGGTMSAFRYLAAHPCVVPSVRKEVDFFGRQYFRGLDWYRTFFPTRATRSLVSTLRAHPTLTFEASSDYLFHPYAAERTQQVLPHARFIAFLRNPVDRAYGHYLHMVRLGFEDRSFEEALALEEERITPDMEMMGKDPLYYPGPFYRFSYVTKGFYAKQLDRWKAHFPPAQLLIMRSDDLFHDSRQTYRRALDFLDLPAWEPKGFKNVRHPRGITVPHAPMEPSTRRMLTETFAPHNRRLEELLQREFGWDRPLGWEG